MGAFILILIAAVCVGFWKGSRCGEFDWQEFLIGFVAGFLGISFGFGIGDTLSGCASCTCP